MIGLFAIEPMFDPLLWFGLTLFGLFSAFSFLTINFYAQGIAKAGNDPKGHVKLAAWRETGALLGICVAAVAPTLLMGYNFDAFTAFAWGFTAATVAAIIWMWPEWTSRVQTDPTPIRAIWNDSQARRLLLLALVNATPLAVSSTLFLFYVESALGAVGWEGGLLVLFFLAAACSSPVWSKLAARFGEKPVLLVAMVLAILSFGFAATLGQGDVILFAIVCVLSGATIGADLTLLPALFAKRTARRGHRDARGALRARAVSIETGCDCLVGRHQTGGLNGVVSSLSPDRGGPHACRDDHEKVTSRFTADFEASWTGNVGIMKEVFHYDSGNVQHREWKLTLGNDGAIKAEAADLIGAGTGQQKGSAVLLNYKIKLSDEAGGYVLDTTDWMYLMSNGSIMNRSQFRKFGIKVAELVATMRPAEGGQTMVAGE